MVIHSDGIVFNAFRFEKGIAFKENLPNKLYCLIFLLNKNEIYLVNKLHDCHNYNNLKDNKVCIYCIPSWFSLILWYVVHSISFQTIFVWAFKIVVDSSKFSMLLLFILWDDWPIFMILSSNEQLQQELEYTLLKPDYHSWWISKMQSGHEDTLEERYAIKFPFKLGKNATETYGILLTAFWPSCMNWASVFEWHKRFKEGRESVRNDVRCGRSKEVNIPELIGQRVRVRFTMLRF